MKMRRLGSSGPEVSALALGCMAMSGMYGASDDGESIRTIHAAVERGVTLLDTGDFYGMGHNEMLIGRALKELGAGARDKVVLSVKFGAMRGPDGAWIGFDSRPLAVRNFLSYTLQRLRVDYIDIYRPARLDPRVPIEDTAGEIGKLIQKGYVRHLGLSEMSAETVRKAHAVTPVSDLQIEYSLVTRSCEKIIRPVLDELGIGMTAYGVLSRGLLSGSKPAGKGDFRAFLPRFTGDNYAQNQKLVERLEEFGAARGTTATQIAIAWVLSQGEMIVPLVGARTRKQLEESLSAAELTLTVEELRSLEAAVPADAVAGTRYDRGQMAMLDSEK